MQFSIYNNVKEPFVKVSLHNTPIKPSVMGVLIQHFERLGGVSENGDCNDWLFPKCVTGNIIFNIIRNTCFVCGDLMKDSVAYKNEDLYDQPDVLGRQKIYQQAGKAKLIKVRKCSSCGHSHT
jgi:hypothetical protein